ncbi:MAG TPA: SprT-like domain-containing protein [Rhizomicrobium sp.]|nr:SprT-like domain-containing protein [Rhizomicrobium sp.]
MPESDSVGFHVVRDPKMYADFMVERGQPIIRVSESCVGHTATLLEKMAHELCHLRQHLIGARDAHGKTFKSMARQVCKAHGFDPKTF